MRSRAALAAAIALLCELPGGASASGSAALAPPSPPVTDIEVRSDGPIDEKREDLRSLIALAPGEPVTEDRVRRTLRNLQASGLASRVAVYTRPTAGGVGVIVALWLNLRVDRVVVEGDLGKVPVKTLEGALVQREGEPLLETRVLRGLYHLEDLLRDRGYPAAQVHLDVDTDEARKRATVTYEVTVGERATVGSVSFDGDPAPLAPAALIAQLRSQPGQPYRHRTARDDADRLQRWLIEQGYRKASVQPPREQVDAAHGRVDLVFPLFVGPRVEVVIHGGERSRLEKRGLLPFLGAEGYDEALVYQAVDLLRAYYQREGHYRVKIDWHEEHKDGVLRLVLDIEAGPTFVLREVSFRGNREVSDSQLAALIETSPRGFLRFGGGGRLVDQVLADDLRNLRSYYALHGFAGDRVGPPEVREKGHELDLTIPIREGTRRTVGKIAFEGVDSLDLDALRQKLPLQEGGPFHPLLVEDSLDVLRAAYEAKGFTGAQVSSHLGWNAERTQVDITCQVIEGEQQLLGRLIVRGNRRTRRYVIEQAVGVRPGEPISGPQLLEIERSLYRLGIFSRVEVKLVPAELGATTRDVVIRVEEGKVRRITYGAGYDTETGIRTTLGFSNANVLGRAYTFRLDGRASSKEQRFRLVFEQPRRRRFPFAMTYQLFRFEEDRESFRPIRWVGRIEGSRELGALRLGLAYDYRLIEEPATSFRDALRVPTVNDAGESALGPVEPGILSPFEEGRGRVQVSSLVPNLLLDRRDDPLNPTRGWSLSAQGQLAFPLLGARPRFLKLFLQQTGYAGLGDGVVAASLRVGGIEPLGSEGGVRDPHLVPLDERFFAGGQSTHRAYGRLRLGIEGETLDGLLPIGGDGLLLLNSEYRFPIVGPIGGTVFFDSGNVWRDWREIRVGDLKSGVGVGVRYLSPIGPLRLDVGWKLKREVLAPDLAESGVEIFLSFGNPF